jgi:SOS response associated peptidase (SRAP)
MRRVSVRRKIAAIAGRSLIFTIAPTMARRPFIQQNRLLRVEGDKGYKAKQPDAIAMKEGSPRLTSREWVRTFAIATTDANELVAEIHDRMPLIVGPRDYARSLAASRTRVN